MKRRSKKELWRSIMRDIDLRKNYLTIEIFEDAMKKMREHIPSEVMYPYPSVVSVDDIKGDSR